MRQVRKLAEAQVCHARCHAGRRRRTHHSSTEACWWHALQALAPTTTRLGALWVQQLKQWLVVAHQSKLGRLSGRV